MVRTDGLRERDDSLDRAGDAALDEDVVALDDAVALEAALHDNFRGVRAALEKPLVDFGAEMVAVLSSVRDKP